MLQHYKEEKILITVLKRLESFAGHPLTERDNSIFCTVCSSLIIKKTSSIRNHLKTEKHTSNVKAATRKVSLLRIGNLEA